MKFLINIISIGLIVTSCNSSRNMGYVKQGEGGKIISGKVKVTCTAPAKMYTKDLTASIDAELDSLMSIPKSKLNISLNKKMVRIAEYSQKGLDRDLVLFRICEMANNRGFTSKESSRLIEEALKVFDDRVQIINQNKSFTLEEKNEILSIIKSDLDKNSIKCYSLTHNKNSPKSYDLKASLEKFLKDQDIVQPLENRDSYDVGLLGSKFAKYNYTNGCIVYMISDE